jgi:small GTP-binding protein
MIVSQFKEKMTGSKYIKVCIVGDGGVGKTSLLQRYLSPDSEFKDQIPLTTLNIQTKELDDQEHNKIMLVYDFGGQERFRFMLNDLKRIKPDIILLTFDITDLESFLNIKSYYDLINDIKEHDSEYLLVGSKADLERGVFKAEIDQICKKLDIQNYFEVSAKTGEQIESLFRKVVDLSSDIWKNQYETHSEDSWNNLIGNAGDIQSETHYV